LSEQQLALMQRLISTNIPGESGASPRRNQMRVLLLAAFLGFSLPAHAQQAVSGTITQLRTGWNSDSFGVMINAPQINPANCTTNNLGYISTVDQPGYHTYYAAALTAYVARKQVTITVHNAECVGPFPKIIGINMP
jgi:hypothetical protein